MGNYIGMLESDSEQSSEEEKESEEEQQHEEEDGEQEEPKEEELANANPGNWHHDHTNFQQAIKKYEVQLGVAKLSEDRTLELDAYAKLGNAHRRLGDFKQAIDCHRKGLEIAIELKETTGEIDAYGNLGSDYHCLGNFEEALRWHRKELRKAEEVGDNDRQGKANSNVGTDHYSFRRFADGIKCHEKHLSIAKSTGDRKGEGRAYGNIGYGFRKLGKFNDAKEKHQKELQIAKEVGDMAGQANAYLNLGSVHRNLRNFKSAVHFHSWGLAIAKKLSDKVAHGDALYMLGRDWELSGSLEKAIKAYRSSVKLYNEVRDALTNEDNWKISFRDSQQKAYTALWRTLLNCQKIEKALYAAEQGRAQAFVDLLHSRHGVEAPDHLEETIRSYISSEIAIQTVFLAVESNKIHFWVLGGKEIQFRQMELNIVTHLQRSILNALASDENQATARSDNSLRNLYDLIIEPIRDLLEDDELIIVPDGPLFLVPYNALQHGEEETKYLFESFRIRIVPSLTSLKLISDSKNLSNGGALLVGDPCSDQQTFGSERLKNAELEVARIQRILKGKAQIVTTLTGKQATKEEVLRQFKFVSLIHIAAHANVETGEISLAGSGQDRILTMSDVQAVKLQARLVVLSCCNTGRGRVTADGVVGIARAFLAAGARSVLVSLCEVRDESTMNFMQKFYEDLASAKSASVALQRTMGSFKTSEHFSAVRYWAPFVLIGDDVTLDFPAQKPVLMEHLGSSGRYGNYLGVKRAKSASVATRSFVGRRDNLSL